MCSGDSAEQDGRKEVGRACNRAGIEECKVNCSCSIPKTVGCAV